MVSFIYPHVLKHIYQNVYITEVFLHQVNC